MTGIRELTINAESESDALAQIRRAQEFALSGGQTRLKRHGFDLRELQKTSASWNGYYWLTQLKEVQTLQAKGVFVKAVRMAAGAAPYLQIPMRWFGALKRTYRGQERAYYEAVVVLAYVVMRYRTEMDLDPTGMLYLHPSIDQDLDLTTEHRKQAVKYLEEKGLLQRVLVRGRVPWWERRGHRVGSFLFVVPQLAAIANLGK